MFILSKMNSAIKLRPENIYVPDFCSYKLIFAQTSSLNYHLKRNDSASFKNALDQELGSELRMGMLEEFKVRVNFLYET